MRESKMRKVKTLRKMSIIGLILGVFMLKELIWVFIIPPSEAPDEAGHYGYIETLYYEKTLPRLGVTLFSERTQIAGSVSVKDSAQANIDTSAYKPGNQLNWIAQHPPLYYILLLPLYGILPHDNVLFCILILRLASVFLAAVSLYFIFKTIKKLVPENTLLPAAITCGVAFLPTFAFSSAVINNDNLVMTLSSILIYLLVSRDTGYKWSLKTGLLLALLALTKITALPFFIIVLVLQIIEIFRNWKSGNRGKIVLETIIIFAVPLLLAGWWYIRNYVLFGNFMPELKDAVALNPQILVNFPGLLAAFPEIAPNTAAKFGIWNFFVTKDFFFEFYKNIWGAFGRYFVQLSVWQYVAIFGFTIAGLIGQIKNLWGRKIKKIGGFVASGKGVLFFTYVITVSFLAWKIFQISSLRGFLAAMQGRYFLPVAPILFYVLIRGWEYLLGKKWLEAGIKLLVVFFVINEAAALFYILIPAFY